MGWVSGPVVYILIWWIALFMVLPWGNAPVENPVVGHATSAPMKPRLVRKFIVTTVLAAVIWLLVLGVMKAHIVDFSQWADDMVKQDNLQ
jgi:predicted secreted protein